MRRGFSLIELLFVLLILGILLTVIVWSFSSFRDSRLLENSIGDAVSLTDEARVKTISSYNNMQHGVHFEASRMVLFKGTTFSGSDSDNKEVSIHPLMEIVNISLNNSGSDVVFQRINGKTDNYGSVVIRVKSDPSRAKQININSTGVVDVQ